MKNGMTLQELSSEIERQAALKHDFIADTRKLSLSPLYNRLSIQGRSEMYEVTEYAHGQLAERLKIDKRTHDRLRTSSSPALIGKYAQLSNAILDAEPSVCMVRTLGTKARALLSNSYRPIDNVHVARAVLEAFSEYRDVRIVSCSLSESRMHIKALFTRFEGEVNVGDVTQLGLSVGNSEIGDGSFYVDPFTFRLVCKNGMQAPAYGMRKAHLGKKVSETENYWTDETRRADDKAFWLKVRDTVRGILTDDIFQSLLSGLRGTTRNQIEKPVPAVVEVFGERFGLSKPERAGVLDHLIRGGDLSQYGLINAVTRFSQDVPDYDRADELEVVGGKILELPREQWFALAA